MAPELSVVIPVHNEAGNIGPLWQSLVPVLSECTNDWETIWVDDASTDESLAELRQVQRLDVRCRILQLPARRGQSAAFWCGFRSAAGSVIVTLDADLQNDPADIPHLLNALRTADVVVGWRRERHDPLVKRVASRIANSFRNWLTDESIPDTGCSLKAFRREVSDDLFPFHGMHRFFPTLAAMAGSRVTIVPVRHRPRRFGHTKYGIWNRLLGPLADCIAVRWMKNRYIGKVPYHELRTESFRDSAGTDALPSRARQETGRSV